MTPTSHRTAKVAYDYVHSLVDDHRTVERLNRTLQTEWAYRQAFANNDERTAALAAWLEHYNDSTSPQRTRRAAPDQPTVTHVLAR